jgi:hypothetical protein
VFKPFSFFLASIRFFYEEGDFFGIGDALLGSYPLSRRHPLGGAEPDRQPGYFKLISKYAVSERQFSGMA